MIRAIIRTLAVVLAPLAIGCDATRQITITSEPAGAFVQIDGQNTGNAPLTHTFDFRSKYTFIIAGSMSGYFTEEVVLSNRHPSLRSGSLRVVLQEDEAWKATTTSEATNAWLRIQIDPKLSTEGMWQKLIDAVTGAYSSLEQMDSSSGYIRSVATVRKFRSPKGQFSVRTRFTGSVAQKEPLLYKLKIEAEFSTNSGDWAPYTRVFKEDEALIEELQSRLGTK